jgi:autotransporter-associated beta strand protein
VTVNAGTLALTGGVTIDAGKSFHIAGDGVSGGGAIRSLSGTNVINGSITLDANSRIEANANELQIAGGIDTAGREIRFEPAGGNIRVNSEISGSGSVRVAGGSNSVIFQTVSNTYTGNTLIEDGRIVLNGAAATLGSNDGNTEVRNDGTIRLQGGGTIPAGEDLTIKKDGEGGEGAIRNENGDNIINSNITVPSGDNDDNTRIRAQAGSLTINGNLNLNRRINWYGNGTTIVNGQIVHSGGTTNMTKSDNGTLVLANDNTFNSWFAIYDGTVRVTADGALGATSSGTSVYNGSTLEFAQCPY